MIGHSNIVIFGGPASGKSTVSALLLTGKASSHLSHQDKKGWAFGDESTNLKLQVFELSFSDDEPNDQQIDQVLEAAENAIDAVILAINDHSEER